MEKEKVIDNFYEMIKNSWTYAKLTIFEKEQLKSTFQSVPVQEVIKGTYKQRWAILQAIYHTFLKGCGYNDFEWRE